MSGQVKGVITIVIEEPEDAAEMGVADVAHVRIQGFEIDEEYREGVESGMEALQEILEHFDKEKKSPPNGADIWLVNGKEKFH